ncbi:helix-turn-helix domain-containing protein, partial [Candidatus Woesearchaeota archaeon]|nr:helix-turn-helix domain-containing protein [Candidatus Woesearchaeota archaeon]
MDLKELGLTENEAKAYETLLRLGKTSASHISKESGVPYGRIYNVLSSLEE